LLSARMIQSGYSPLVTGAASVATSRKSFSSRDL
jgi:hypothetical protein